MLTQMIHSAIHNGFASVGKGKCGSAGEFIINPSSAHCVAAFASFLIHLSFPYENLLQATR